MTRARKNPLVERWFTGYVAGCLRKSFHRVLVATEAGGLPRRPEGPILVCLSHSNWWDPLVAFWLSRRLGWDGYGPMDERQLRRYPVLTRIGVFGVDRESRRGGQEFLRYACDLLAGKRRALWITPQGELVSPGARPVRFHGGVARLAAALGGCHITTVALAYDFWEERRPELLVSLGPLTPAQVTSTAERAALLRRLERQVEGQLDELAARCRRRDASGMQVALSGMTGIHPLYDAWRRLRARRQGVAFDPSHGALPSPPRWRPPARRSGG